MAIAETLIDNFDDNSISANWNPSTDASVTITETKNRLEIALPNASPRYGFFPSTATYDLTNSHVLCQLVSAGSQTNMDCFPIYIASGSDYIAFNITGNVLVAHTFIGGVDADIGTNLTYSSTVHRWFKIEEIAGTTYWRWSTDGKSWSTHASIATASLFAIIAVTIGFEAGFFGAPGGTTTAIFDNFNYQPGMRLNTAIARPAPFKPGVAR